MEGVHVNIQCSQTTLQTRHVGQVPVDFPQGPPPNCQYISCILIILESPILLKKYLLGTWWVSGTAVGKEVQRLNRTRGQQYLLKGTPNKWSLESWQMKNFNNKTWEKHFRHKRQLLLRARAVAGVRGHLRKTQGAKEMSCSSWEWRTKAGLVLTEVLRGVTDDPPTDVGTEEGKGPGWHWSAAELAQRRETGAARARWQGRPHSAARRWNGGWSLGEHWVNRERLHKEGSASRKRTLDSCIWSMGAGVEERSQRGSENVRSSTEPAQWCAPLVSSIQKAEEGMCFEPMS